MRCCAGTSGTQKTAAVLVRGAYGFTCNRPARQSGQMKKRHPDRMLMLRAVEQGVDWSCGQGPSSDRALANYRFIMEIQKRALCFNVSLWRLQIKSKKK